MPAYLALGDSYTIGEGVAPSERWPVRVARALREAGVPVDDPEIVAATGWTTGELAAALDAADLRGSYALVTLLIGVNDQYRGRSTADYLTGFHDLLARAVALAGGSAARVIVVSIPDWGVAPFAEGRDRAAIAQAIDEFNVTARDAAERAGAWWVDITAESRVPGNAASAYAADGLHPSGDAYRVWAALVSPVARRALKVATAR